MIRYIDIPNNTLFLHRGEDWDGIYFKKESDYSVMIVFLPKSNKKVHLNTTREYSFTSSTLKGTLHLIEADFFVRGECFHRIFTGEDAKV